MSNEYHSEFLKVSEEQIALHPSVPAPSVPPNFTEFLKPDEATARLNSSRQRGLEYLDDQLSKFEKHFSRSSNKVLWASDYNAVFSHLRNIISANHLSSITIDSDDPHLIFQEIGLSYFVRDEHLSSSPSSPSLQVFAPNLIIPESGGILFANRSPKLLSLLNNSNVNIFILTINNVLPSASYAELFSRFAALSNASPKSKGISLLYRSNHNCHNYVILLDNQRSNLLAQPQLRPALSCIGCNRCSSVCPVFQTVGDKPYNNVFSGPIGAVVLPHLETVESYHHVSYACTLCGRCEEACPLNLPIRDMILFNRQQFLASGSIESTTKHALFAYSTFVSNRSKLNASPLVKKLLLSKFLSPVLKQNRVLPPFEKATFNKQQTNPNNNDSNA